MLTARGRPEDVLKGFAPVRTITCRSRSSSPSCSRASTGCSAQRLDASRRRDESHLRGKTIDFDALELRVDDRLPLTLMEANLLRYLIQHEGKAVSRKAMLEEVWGVHEDTDTRAIDNFIVRLRRYIEKEPAGRSTC